MRVKSAAINLLRPLILLALRAFYDKRYLTGRHFESGNSGIGYALRSVWTRNILRLATPYPFPAALGCTISRPSRIVFHPDDLNNFQTTGSYFQNLGADISIGKGTYIAPNVGIITTNHQQGSLAVHAAGEDVRIGNECWIGMNAVILPGVILGPHTVVGAGAVVTKSFADGHCVLAGVPARVVSKNSAA